MTINSAVLSLEHHLLRVLNDAEPTTLAQAIARVTGPNRFPGFTALGLPQAPSHSALNAWHRLIKEN
ncbi:hypothetical protein [Deinococcus aquatilis]|uniref:hypothetical protein n=1 Tax=Deinococcus aquatilis TaxID=519440 RepID=UPI000368EBB0|nr:hypothetical protein [Deinococcus aquatilis]